MAMSPRLLRPSASLHPEVVDWRNRVVANGATVSSGTLIAVSRFCRAIDAAGIRGKFYRLNLFCGNSLNAALVPLYRGQSPTGTQLGGTYDQSLGSPSFGEADYNERGANAGLTVTGDTAATKYLDTQFFLNTGTFVWTNSHFSADLKGYTHPANRNYPMIGSNFTGATHRYGMSVVSTNNFFGQGNATYVSGALGTTSTAFAVENTTNGAVVRGGLWNFTRTSTSNSAMYLNGVFLESAAAANTASYPTTPVTVFTINSDTGPATPSSITLRSYSIGTGLSASDAAAFSNIMAAFRTALGRP